VPVQGGDPQGWLGQGGQGARQMERPGRPGPLKLNSDAWEQFNFVLLHLNTCYSVGRQGEQVGRLECLGQCQGAQA
jgi:hypothetical protein